MNDEKAAFITLCRTLEQENHKVLQRRKNIKFGIEEKNEFKETALKILKTPLNKTSINDELSHHTPSN